MQEEFRNGFLH